MIRKEMAWSTYNKMSFYRETKRNKQEPCIDQRNIFLKIHSGDDDDDDDERKLGLDQPTGFKISIPFETEHHQVFRIEP